MADAGAFSPSSIGTGVSDFFFILLGSGNAVVRAPMSATSSSSANTTAFVHPLPDSRCTLDSTLRFGQSFGVMRTPERSSLLRVARRESSSPSSSEELLRLAEREELGVAVALL